MKHNNIPYSTIRTRYEPQANYVPLNSIQCQYPKMCLTFQKSFTYLRLFLLLFLPRSKRSRFSNSTVMYVFSSNVYDVTSTLDLKVYDSSLMTSLNESLGRISIPLLRIQNGQMKWYALKDKSNRSSAKGKCPRVLLEMSLFWNPVSISNNHSTYYFVGLTYNRCLNLISVENSFCFRAGHFT